MDIKIKKLTETATIPTKAHDTDACFDIYADCKGMVAHKYNIIFGRWDTIEDAVAISPKTSVTLNTGFSTEIPNGYFAPVFCRSGMGIKRNLRLSNSVGIIDSDYRGEWKVALYNDGKETQIIYHGDRIAQFAILPVLDINLIESDELIESDRGSGGFGSTGV